MSPCINFQKNTIYKNHHAVICKKLWPFISLIKVHSLRCNNRTVIVPGDLSPFLIQLTVNIHFQLFYFDCNEKRAKYNPKLNTQYHSQLLFGLVKFSSSLYRSPTFFQKKGLLAVWKLRNSFCTKR